MSITFYISGCEKHQEEKVTHWSKDAFLSRCDKEDLAIQASQPWTSVVERDGDFYSVESVPLWPELNASNNNAQYILREFCMMPFAATDDSSVGEIPCSEFGRFINALMVYKNKDRLKDGMTEEGFKEGNMMYFGRSLKQVNRYIDTLLEMFIHARKVNADSIYWG